MVQAKKVLGILAGTDVPLETLVAWAASADVVIAADGAANRLLGSGIMPNVIIGDMDSLDPVIEGSNLVLEEDFDQETTDCDKLLAYARRMHPDGQFFLTGLEGDRFDHVLASLHSTGRLYPEARLVLRDGFAWFVKPGKGQTISTSPGQTVSLIPLLPCEGVQMTGVQWPPNRSLSPIGFTSISNSAAAENVTATLDSGLALLVLQCNVTHPRWE